MRRSSLLVSTLALLLTLQAPVAALAQSTVADWDGDGLSNADEDRNGDGDIDPNETDPLKSDTDGGGEGDGSERAAGRNPFEPGDDFTADRDADGVANGIETELGTNPDKLDSDGDGVDDKTDPFPLEKAFTRDNDRDGVADEWELIYELSDKTPLDAELDPDSDGLINREEFIQNTDPHAVDTDRDGLSDGREFSAGTDPEGSDCLEYSAENQKVFTDLESHWAAAKIRLLSGIKISSSQQTIVGGYETDAGLTFLPDRPVTRYEFLKMSLLGSCVALLEDSTRLSLPFTDTPARTDESLDAIMRRRVIGTAVAYGIVKGYDDGTFRPDAPVTRAEAVKILLTAARLPSLTADENGSSVVKGFKDVTSDAWYAGLVRQAAGLLIVTGYDDGTFRPEKPITRAEATVIILRVIRYNLQLKNMVMDEMEAAGISSSSSSSELPIY